MWKPGIFATSKSFPGAAHFLAGGTLYALLQNLNFAIHFLNRKCALVPHFYQTGPNGQLSLLPSAGWEMSSSLRAIQDKVLLRLIGVVVCLLATNPGSNCPSRMDGRIVRCCIISSCQSADTFETVSVSGHESVSSKKRFTKVPTDLTFTFPN